MRLVPAQPFYDLGRHAEVRPYLEAYRRWRRIDKRCAGALLFVCVAQMMLCVLAANSVWGLTLQNIGPSSWAVFVLAPLLFYTSRRRSKAHDTLMSEWSAALDRELLGACFSELRAIDAAHEEIGDRFKRERKP